VQSSAACPLCASLAHNQPTLENTMMNRIFTAIERKRAVNHMPYSWRPAPPRR
jgi:hypothetical protein